MKGKQEHGSETATQSVLGWKKVLFKMNLLPYNMQLFQLIEVGHYSPLCYKECSNFLS